MKGLPAAAFVMLAFSACMSTDQNTDTLEIEPAWVEPSLQPSWGLEDAQKFPDCFSIDSIPADATTPRHLIVQTRVGKPYKVWFSAAQMREIHESWDNESGNDDLFTLGACER
jgi:hypothetical protein